MARVGLIRLKKKSRTCGFGLGRVSLGFKGWTLIPSKAGEAALP